MKRSELRKLRKRGGPSHVAVLGLALLLGVLSGCAREPAGEGGASQAGGKQPAGSGMVAAEKVAGCAGFSVEKAAEFLSLPAAELKDSSSDLYEKLRMCRFSSAQDLSKGLSFSLRQDDSVEEASEEMARLRENAGLAQGAIAGVTNEQAKGPALEEIRGIGDEAIWMPINDTLNVRKGNVSIQIQSPSEPEAQKRLAELVVAGLS